MITFNQSYDGMSFKGLSTDEKPSEEYKGYKLKNGSTFYEIDTGDVYMYDEENDAWIKQ